MSNNGDLKYNITNKSTIMKFLTINVDVPEWLSGMTRNHVGFARAGSNPAVHAFFFSNWFST